MSKLNKRIDQVIKELNSKIIKQKMDISQISKLTKSYYPINHKKAVIGEMRKQIMTLKSMKEVE